MDRATAETDVPEQFRSSAKVHEQQSMILMPLDADGVTVERHLTVYGYDDAFYVPLGRFGGVLRPGPNLRIHVRRDVPRPAC